MSKRIDFKILSQINDSKEEKLHKRVERVSDSKRRLMSLKKKIKDELDETETTDEAVDVVRRALSTEPAEDVAIAAVEILASTIDLLQEQIESTVEDSARKPANRMSFRALKKKIKDELDETETTDEAVDVVMSFLEDQEAEDVVRATLDVIGQTVDELSAQL